MKEEEEGEEVEEEEMGSGGESDSDSDDEVVLQLGWIGRRELSGAEQGGCFR